MRRYLSGEGTINATGKLLDFDLVTKLNHPLRLPQKGFLKET